MMLVHISYYSKIIKTDEIEPIRVKYLKVVHFSYLIVLDNLLHITSV